MSDFCECAECDYTTWVLWLSKGTKRVERGCTLDFETDSDPNWCLERQGCAKCSKTGCNIANSQNMQCFRCEDSEGDKSSTNPNIFE